MTHQGIITQLFSLSVKLGGGFASLQKAYGAISLRIIIAFKLVENCVEPTWAPEDQRWRRRERGMLPT
jgi:hypothetical protein